MTQVTSEIRDKSLYNTAWYCEYFAVSVGIYLAISLAVPGLGDSPAFIDWINFGGIMLILLFGAFVELTKIPLATAVYYSVRLSWKIIFLMMILMTSNLSLHKNLLTPDTQGR